MTLRRISMTAKTFRLACLLCLGLLAGCRSREITDGMDRYVADAAAGQTSAADFARTSLETEFPDLTDEQTSQWYYSNSHNVLPPRLREPWELQLEQAIRMALARSKIMRDIGGAVVDAPRSVSSVFDPAIVETDPLRGVPAALSAFDAQLGTRLFFSGIEQTLNNAIEGQGTLDPRTTFAFLDLSLVKTAPNGTRFALGNLSTFDRNNSPLNRFPESYTGDFRGEIRHPLWQGAGHEFNQVAGPNGLPGEYRGVWIARLNTDVEIADFQASIRDLLFNVERAYWELYFAYRDLDAKLAGRDATLETWRAVKARLDTGAADGAEEALARERYFASISEIEAAFSGLPVGVASRSAPTNGVNGYQGGMLAAERRLRFLIGLPVYDGKLIRPADEPVRAEVVFDRPASLDIAFQRRVELRRQMLTIQRQEMELTAARNFVQPRLDLVGSYRVHGFGENLFGSPATPNGSAYGDLFRGDLQDWVVGMEWTAPVGFRQGNAAVRNSQLKLMREKAILREQEHQIAHELDAAFAELHRSFATSRANYNRRVAARQRANAVRDKYQADDIPLEFVEDAQQRAVEADAAFARAQVDHAMALATVHFARGTYLDYVGVHLSEAATSLSAGSGVPVFTDK